MRFLPRAVTEGVVSNLLNMAEFDARCIGKRMDGWRVGLPGLQKIDAVEGQKEGRILFRHSDGREKDVLVVSERLKIGGIRCVCFRPGPFLLEHRDGQGCGLTSHRVQA